MKVPPTNNMNGFNNYENEHYFNEGPPTNNAPTTNGNGANEGYAPAPPVEDTDFSEYMWMENEEEFDKEVLQRLEEEELMEQCMLQHMLDDDRPPQANNTNSNSTNQMKTEPAEVAKSSTLNPHAAEFVPSWGRAPVPEQKSS